MEEWVDRHISPFLCYAVSPKSLREAGYATQNLFRSHFSFQILVFLQKLPAIFGSFSLLYFFPLIS